jgi:hypothetical protein
MNKGGRRNRSSPVQRPGQPGDQAAVAATHIRQKIFWCFAGLSLEKAMISKGWNKSPQEI